tara:strand:+ start:20 stop:220 length:201 start_codon:yes stop_codon:yes gene_type:complete
METELKKELTELILKLTNVDYESFCSNYNIKDKGRDMLEFIQDLDEDNTEEVISEIHFNADFPLYN